MPGLEQFIINHYPELLIRINQHLVLTGVSTGMGVLIGVPLGIMMLRFRPLRGFILGFVGILQTVPSLAMLAFLLPFFGIGAKPAMIALTLYALLPIVRNTYVGLDSIPHSLLEATESLGFTNPQRLRMVEIPLALPVILAGIRTAAVIGVGIATLSAFIGAGGLGDFINRGLAMDNTRLILLGAIPSAILALIIDFSIALGEEWLKPGRKKRGLNAQTAVFVIAIGALFTGMTHFGASLTKINSSHTGGVVRIGCKNFTEQMILGEMMAQMIEAHTDLRVENKFDLGGTIICHQALVDGGIDLYPEYTGTALTAILRHRSMSDPQKVYELVKELYHSKFKCDWLAPFGFDNTYALAVRDSDAQKYGWRTISDLQPMASRLRAGFTSEFRVRSDGYPGLVHTYGFSFGKVSDMEPALMYAALKNNAVDVVSAYSTDGRITAYHFTTLQDNLHFFPPYYAAPVVREAALKAHPEILKALAPLGGAIDDDEMRKLNYEVDVLQKSPYSVAHQFLLNHHFIP